MFDRIRFYLRSLFARTQLDREMRDEMESHLDRRTEGLMASGLTADEARLAARRKFGNVAAHHEAARDAWRLRWLESIVADARFAFRYFARKPLSSITIVLVLAFGIGGHAFQVSLLRGVTTRPASRLARGDRRSSHGSPQRVAETVERRFTTLRWA